MAWHWIFNAFFLGILSFIIFHKFIPPNLSKYFYPALIIKLLSGISVGLLYINYYKSGDTTRFQDLASNLYHYGIRDLNGYFNFMLNSGGILPQISFDLSGEPRTLFFVKFLSLLNFISGGSYWINSLYLSFFSFLGSWILIQKIMKCNPELLIPAVISFAFFPTIVFWSSGILKESLGMLCFGIISSVFLDFYIEGKVKPLRIIMFIAFTWVYWQLKYYIVIILIIAIAGFLLADLIKSRYRNLQGLIVFPSCIFVLTFIASFLHPNFNPGILGGILKDNHELIIAISSPGNIVPFISSGHPNLDLILNIPISLIAGLFMPLPFQGEKLIAVIPGLLNLLILLSAVRLFYKGVQFPSGRSGLLVYAMIFYIATLSVMLAYSNPNFGTLERYKVCYLPLFLFMILAGQKSLTSRLHRIIKHLNSGITAK
jgi:hypothetical protein